MLKHLTDYVDRVLISEDEIKNRIREIGRKITEDYHDDPADLILVCILRGAAIFMADLIKEIDLDMEIDFMSVSSYGANTVSSGDVRIIKDLEQNITGKNVIIVEDIIDTGYTLHYLTKNMIDRGAKSVKIAALLNKQDRRVTNVQGDYVGFEIPDEFVIGYGLDFDQKLRNLPYVATLKPKFYR